MLIFQSNVAHFFAPSEKKAGIAGKSLDDSQSYASSNITTHATNTSTLDREIFCKKNVRIECKITRFKKNFETYLDLHLKRGSEHDQIVSSTE